MNVIPIVHQNLSDKIYELLKEMIVRWEYRPGQRLIDSELAQQYGVSRSLIRNAITLLVNESMVEVSYRRFYVARFSQKDIRDILQLRQMLETHALPAAIAHTSDDELADMEAKMAEAERLFADGDVEPFYALDVETHRTIIDKGDNDYIKKVYGNLLTLLRMVIRSDFDKQRKISESFREHRAFFEAWRRRDVKAAAKALGHHLDRAEERVMENFSMILGDDTAGDETADSLAIPPPPMKEDTR
jgi:DNA-binding GntR family transcriptional regulator